MPLLPRPPDGWVWADIFSGWIALFDTSKQHPLAGGVDATGCVVAPDALPKAMRLLPVENATRYAKIIAEEDAEAEAAWQSDFKYTTRE